MTPDSERITPAGLAWAALAPGLAARGRIRISRDGGRTYPRRNEVDVTTVLPNQPTAVLLYTHQGTAPVLVFDLDASKGGSEAVQADFRSLRTILSDSGASWFSDHSPNGGVHVYVPLQEPITYHQGRQVIAAAAASHPTVDPSPMGSIASGCIRPPGARHRTGGHQVLHGTLQAAQDALGAPTRPAAWARVTAALAQLGRDSDRDSGPDPHHGVDPAQAVARAGDAGVLATAGQLEPLRGYQQPDATYTAIARTGDYDTSRYATPSEARQGVIWAAVASGWSLVDVARRLQDGTWAGLAAMYARYRPHHRHQALTRDWRAAVTFEKRRRETSSKSPVRLCTTSPHKAQRGTPRATRDPRGSRSTDVSSAVREWLTAVDLLSGDHRPLGIADRTVLHALAQAAVLTGSMVVEHGNRSLAIATGLDPSTISRVLTRLLALPVDRALVDRVRDARGVRAHAWHLVIPPLLVHAATTTPWRRGRIHGIRPAFRQLGPVAALVYAALERLDRPASGRDIAHHARVGHTAAAEALTTLASWGLATRGPHGWQPAPDAAELLRHYAEAWGLDAEIRDQIDRYRAERRAWWRRLGLVDAPPAALRAVGDGCDRDPPPLGVIRSESPPPDPHIRDRERIRDHEAEQLIIRELGGARIA